MGQDWYQASLWIAIGDLRRKLAELQAALGVKE